jgi:hypothetical protein
MIFLAKLGIGFVGTVALGGAMICSEGFIDVQVHERQANGTNVFLIVPAALVPMALRFVPSDNFGQVSAKLRPYLPIVDSAMPALEQCPDGILVEVIDPREHVMIAKQGGSIVVDVRDREETVHVAVPLRAARSAIHEIAEAGGPI